MNSCLILICVLITLQNLHAQDPVSSPPFENPQKSECSCSPGNYKAEWQFNRSGNTNDVPQFGLALSGGGLRSGYFSIGILKGLNERHHILEKVDVISSVSGGGYAASWFYIQSINSGYRPDELFESSGKFQSYLVNHGELVSHAAANLDLLRQIEYGVNGLEIVGSIPVNAVANFLFGMRLNVSPIRRAYQRGIDRDFHINPGDHGERSPLDFIGFEDFSMFLNPPKHFEFGALAKEVKNHGLPFFIINNTTAHIEDATVEDEALLNSRVFEFTPLHFGSDYFGYYHNCFPFDYNRAIAVSGAAADPKRLRDSNQRFVASIANYDLGFSIDNPAFETGYAL